MPLIRVAMFGNPVFGFTCATPAARCWLGWKDYSTLRASRFGPGHQGWLNSATRLRSPAFEAGANDCTHLRTGASAP